jgi:hypothetical protein
MNSILCTTAVFLALASFPTAHATGSKDSKVPHLSHSAANPSNSRVSFSNYHVGIHVSGYALSQMTVELPQDLKLSQSISAQTQSGQNIAATVSVADGKAKFIFAQPVAPETMLELVFNSVKISTPVSRIWLLPVSGQKVGTTTEIPLGTAQIHTYH